MLGYGLNAGEAYRFGLPCGGTLRLTREKLSPTSRLEPLLLALKEGRVVRRTTNLRTGEVRLDNDVGESGAVRFDGEFLSTVHGPTWRLLLIGCSQLSEYVAAMAVPLGYAVTICDPRLEYSLDSRVSGVDVVRSMPDDTVTEIKLDARSAVVALTHDPKLDDLALLEALETPAIYVGAIGSRRNSDARISRLKFFELCDEALAKLRCPVGLYLGGSTPLRLRYLSLPTLLRGVTAFQSLN